MKLHGTAQEAADPVHGTAPMRARNGFEAVRGRLSVIDRGAHNGPRQSLTEN
jgi:hypothetical protein